MFEAILRSEPWAISLCLRTLGRDRGYVVRQDTTPLSSEEGLAVLLEAHRTRTGSR